MQKNERLRPSLSIRHNNGMWKPYDWRERLPYILGRIKVLGDEKYVVDWKDHYADARTGKESIRIALKRWGYSKSLGVAFDKKTEELYIYNLKRRHSGRYPWGESKEEKH